jgi:hypothetical protein
MEWRRHIRRKNDQINPKEHLEYETQMKIHGKKNKVGYVQEVRKDVMQKECGPWEEIR